MTSSTTEPQDRGYQFCAVCETNASPGSTCLREDCGLPRNDRGRITNRDARTTCPECGCGPGENHRPDCRRGPFAKHKTPRRVA